MRRPISRRTFLRGAAACIAIPMLEAMQPRSARAAAAAVPRRLITYFMPNGIYKPMFLPASPGPLTALTPTLQPLAPVQNQVLVLSGLNNAPCINGISGADHEKGTGTSFTISHVSAGSPYNGVSLDQMAAQLIGQSTVYPSIALGTQSGDGTAICNGLSCLYQTTTSWAANSTPNPKLTVPTAIFNQLFASFNPQGGATKAALQNRGSILDYIGQEAKLLNLQLGKADQTRMQQYLDSVRQVEVSLQAQLGQTCDVGVAPSSASDFPTVINQMNALMTLAIQCDMTRVLSFMFANSTGGLAYEWLGISKDWHLMGHYTGNEGDATPEQKQTTILPAIDQWNMQQVANLASGLQAIDEGAATALDNTMICVVGELGDSAAHTHSDMSVLVVGGQNILNTGRYLDYPAQPSAADLYAALLVGLGASVTAFGEDGTGILPGILL